MVPTKASAQPVLKIADGADVNLLTRGQQVVQALADSLAQLHDSLDGQFVAACEMIICAPRQLVLTGMGKSGLIARKVAATFASTGTPAIFIHPAEAAHGDLGMLVAGDVLLVLSNSGNTPELRPILAHARRLAVPIIGVASSPGSLVLDEADVAITLPRVREACAANIAPTSSTAMQLALGDALAMAVMDRRGIEREDLRLLHPGGNIGLELTRVEEIMHTGPSLPLVPRNVPMSEVISTITAGRFGIAGVLDEAENLIGVITDGDLRRHLDELHRVPASGVMNGTPKTISPDMLAADALVYLNQNAITAAFVVEQGEPARRPLGIIHMHDLVRFGLT